MDYEKFFREQIDLLKRAGNYRVFAELQRLPGRFPCAAYHDEQGQSSEVEVWCSNDYLGMGQHPAVLQAMHEALEASAGAGGTRNISGTSSYHVQLERELAGLHGKTAALLFTSGYVSNLAALSTITRLIPDCVVFSDADNHNSMIAGIRAGGATKHIFRHNDPEHLAYLMKDYPAEQTKLVAFESIYSMSGDIAPIGPICEVAEHHRALTYVDEVHAVGLYGHKGGGIAQRDGCSERITIIQGSLAKAYGVMGGYIAASESIVDCVRSFGHSFIFTTALAPALVAGALASVRHLCSSNVERSKHQQRVQQLKQLLAAANLPAKATPSHIVPVMVSDSRRCKRISDELLRQHRIYVQPINYPTVPHGSERLRLTPTPLHDESSLDRLVTAMRKVWED